MLLRPPQVAAFLAHRYTRLLHACDTRTVGPALGAANCRYLTKHPRTGMFWFRRRVPDALRAAVGKREFVQSLRTRDPRQARAGAAKLTAETDILLTDLERKATAAAPDPTPFPAPTRDAAAPHGPGGWVPPPPKPLPGDAEMRSAVA